MPFFAVESTLSFPCSRSNLQLSRQGAALAHLDSLPSHDMVIWTDCFDPFFFLSDSAILSSVFPFTSISVADLAGSVLSFLLYYQATVSPRTLVSPMERRD